MPPGPNSSGWRRTTPVSTIRPAAAYFANSGLPPPNTIQAKDSSHGGNPGVREDVLEKKQAQHVMWVYERPENGGRGFGFTGGHNHWNWAQDDQRKVVLNAIIWIAGGTVPEGGAKSTRTRA